MKAILRALAVLSCLALVACSSEDAPARTTEDPTPEVRVAEIVEWPYPAFSELPGVVSPGKRAVLSTRMSGSLTSVHKVAGDPVTEGELVATVDASELKAGVTAARDRVDAAEAAASQAELNTRRLQGLYAEDLIARVRVEEARIQLSQREAQLQAARAELQSQRTNLSYTRLTAPFDGMVTEVLVDPGTFVGPGQPLVVVEDRSSLQVDAPLSTEQAAGLTPGQPLSVLVDARDAEIPARVISVIPALGEDQTGQRLKLAVDSADTGIRPGQVVSVRLPRAASPDSSASTAWVALPPAALIKRGQLTGALVLGIDDTTPRVHLRWIRTATPPAGASELVPVTQGLQAGEQVVVNPSPHLRDGQAVSVIPLPGNTGGH